MENLAAAVALAPEHLSCYGLKVEEGTPLYAVRDSAGLPGDEEQADICRGKSHRKSKKYATGEKSSCIFRRFLL